MSNKKPQGKKTAEKNDRAVLIALIAALVIVVAVVVVLVVSMANDVKEPPEPETFAVTQSEPKTYDTTPLEEATRADVTGSVDMAAVKAEIDSHKVKDFVEADGVTEYVMFNVKDYGSFVIRVRPDVAPISARNFQNIVAQQLYDGSTFHRVMPNFMIQGGSVSVPVDQIKGEFAQNGVKNDLSHIAGVISMARTTVPDSATSQFFISNDSSRTPASLDGAYAAFGYVVAGMDTVMAITNVELTYDARGELSKPTSTILIENAFFVKLK